MSKFKNLKEFLSQHIMGVPFERNQHLKDEHREKNEDHKKRWEETNHGKHDKKDKDDWIY